MLIYVKSKQIGVSRMKKDLRFLLLARQILKWSKDPKRKIGAILVDPKLDTIISEGYNGLPRKVEDTELRLNNIDVKLDLTIHAEMNCLINALHSRSNVKDSTLYVFGLPVCSRCAVHIIQAGISRVVFCCDEYQESKWYESCEQAILLFSEAGVNLAKYTEEEVDGY